jgi:hypothetical protein
VTLLDRIERATGVPGLAGLLGGLPPADLRSLLLEVNRRQAARVKPSQVLAQYRRDKFTGPAAGDPSELAAFDRQAFEVLRLNGYTPVELSPVCPLGTVSTLSPLDQNLVLTTERGTEVTADSTNALALESAVRRTGHSPVKLCASHRLLRTQPFPDGWSQHFRLLALTIAGRDSGSFHFETDSLMAQFSAIAALLPNCHIRLTDLNNRKNVLQERVVEPLNGLVDFDDDRQKGRGYYVDACYDVRVNGVSIGDGGFTTWTQQLLGNAKERFLTGGLGIDMLLSAALYP